MLNRLHDALGLRTSPAVFFSSAAVMAVFVIGTIAFTDALDSATRSASQWWMTNMGWFYVVGVTVFLGFLLYMAASRYGRVKLGPADEEPEHSSGAWFAMLFAAGIGSILMFWGVAEPVSHLGDPPRESTGIAPNTVAAAKDAMNFTYYHFGLHTWTIFTLPALCFAYFIHKRNLPPRVSSIFQPILGEGIHGPVGKLIDVVAVVGTVFGIAVSIGLGTLQINGGLSDVAGVPENAGWQLIIIGVVCGIALISVSLGLDKGIKVLSNINIVVAIGLLIFILIAGSTLFMLKGTFESLGTYLQTLPELALWNDTFADTGWQNTFTVFYWAWTITWSPFVGIFIARISRGRTIRQFVLGVLAAPTAFSVLWFGIFGYGSFDIELRGDEPGGLVKRVVTDEDVPGALFAFLEHFPFTPVVSVIAIALVVVFFVTSVDSAALVTDTMANGHEDFNPLRQRIFWAVAIGIITATLLVFSGSGGLEALQSTIILVGFPFFVMAYFQMYAVHRALREDAGELPPVRTRGWKRVLPPEEFERREDCDDVFSEEYDDSEEFVVEPEATEEAPEFRDPYVDPEEQNGDEENGEEQAAASDGTGPADEPSR